MARFRGLVLLGLLAGAAMAETEVDAYGLGHHDPVPESWLKLDEDLSIRVRVLDSRGKLIERVAAPQTLTAEVSLYGREGAADRDVRLVCSAFFIDSGAGWSEAVIDDKPCYEGRLSDATGQFVPLTLDLQFRPVASDPSGTSAVVVEVHDLVVKDHVTIYATYDWQGGRK